METLAAVLDRRLAQLPSVRASRLNRETWRMADDRYFHRLHRVSAPDLDVVNAYTRRRDQAMSGWPGAPASSMRWGSGLSRQRFPRLKATGWQWLGWLLSPRFPVR